MEYVSLYSSTIPYNGKELGIAIPIEHYYETLDEYFHGISLYATISIEDLITYSQNTPRDQFVDHITLLQSYVRSNLPYGIPTFSDGTFHYDDAKVAELYNSRRFFGELIWRLSHEPHLH